jgi:hypothetical protein
VGIFNTVYGKAGLSDLPVRKENAEKVKKYF